MSGEEDTGAILELGWRERMHLKESEQVQFKGRMTNRTRIWVCENKMSQVSPELLCGAAVILIPGMHIQQE